MRSCLPVEGKPEVVVKVSSRRQVETGRTRDRRKSEYLPNDGRGDLPQWCIKGSRPDCGGQVGLYGIAISVKGGKQPWSVVWSVTDDGSSKAVLLPWTGA